MPSVRIVGPGRAGRALAGALQRAGWDVAAPVHRGEDPSGACSDVDVCVVATPDAAIPEVAAAMRPVAETLVVHLSGATGLEPLDGHERRAGFHPLVALPDVPDAWRRLVGAWFAVDGDPGVAALVEAVEGTAIRIDATDRALHHAACCVAANHVTALVAQVERLSPAGVPAAAYLDLALGAIENCRTMGAADAITGPAARGDWLTLERHYSAIPPVERPLYRQLAAEAARLAGRSLPPTPDGDSSADA